MGVPGVLVYCSDYGFSWANCTTRTDQGLVRDDEANAFFTAAEMFAQLQDSKPSSQRVDFNPTGRFAGIGGEFVGFNSIAGPAG